MQTMKTDQTVRMCWRICVFIGCKCQKVHFLKLCLIPSQDKVKTQMIPPTENEKTIRQMNRQPASKRYNIIWYTLTIKFALGKFTRQQVHDVLRHFFPENSFFLPQEIILHMSSGENKRYYSKCCLQNVLPRKLIIKANGIKC